MLFIDQAGDTKVVWETRSPTWDQTIVFKDLIIWGDREIIKENPPLILTEIFDYDEGGDIEFIGRDTTGYFDPLPPFPGKIYEIYMNSFQNDGKKMPNFSG